MNDRSRAPWTDLSMIPSSGPKTQRYPVPWCLPFEGDKADVLGTYARIVDAQGNSRTAVKLPAFTDNSPASDAQPLIPSIANSPARINRLISCFRLFYPERLCEYFPCFEEPSSFGAQMRFPLLGCQVEVEFVTTWLHFRLKCGLLVVPSRNLFRGPVAFASLT